MRGFAPSTLPLQEKTLKSHTSVASALLAGVLATSALGATAPPEVSAEPEPSEDSPPVGSEQRPPPIRLECEVCASTTPLVLRPTLPHRICDLQPGQRVWVFDFRQEYAQAYVPSGDCALRRGWLLREAIAPLGGCR